LRWKNEEKTNNKTRTSKPTTPTHRKNKHDKRYVVDMKNAHKQSTIKRVARQQMHLERNCNKSDRTNESYDNETTQPNASKEQTQYKTPASLYEQTSNLRQSKPA
jgi:hypothetical protein